MWETLGFSKNPYDANPLKPTKDDVDLLIGRVEDGIKFGTIIESANRGTILISGLPGVGKTSFFNVQQYLMESGEAAFGKKIISARSLCSIQTGDKSIDIALRVLHNTCRNIAEFCKSRSFAIPGKAYEIFEWLNGKRGGGFNFSLSIAGFGGGGGKQVQLPAPKDSSFEVLQIILSSIVEEAVTLLDIDGIFIALDNAENLDDEGISAILMSFRDTFFTIENIWWIVIGQTGLSSLIQVLDPRVAERMTGGIELTPITADELHTAIDRRVERFHQAEKGKAPLTQDVHDFLYESSLGEIRFVFKYASSICTEFVSQARSAIMKQIGSLDKLGGTAIRTRIDTLIGSVLVNNQIPSNHSMDIVRKIISEEINNLGLRHKERDVLKRIGENGTATQSEFKLYGLNSGQDFSSNYLSKFHKQHLLAKSQEGRRVHYSLRGIAAIAGRFNLFDGASKA
ncbi:Cdc6/Cdc18 family protein [Neoroseomonas soli]|uniref:Uncharacterized protein n=1 Tax=Neoroseomonas soli TaxID=1081025 RepID=A0A9X9X1T7_9PROT|nr:hypothetical protein [Neoroseomonas soli]MBR0673366.1 hypothetical protein [Neoroseomonas soli]